MRKTLLALAAAAVAVAIAGATGAWSDSSVTIGQNLPGANIGCSPAYIIPSGQSAYVVPPGNWNVTSWSTQTGRDGAPTMNLMVFRATGNPGEYKVVGVSENQVLSTNALNTFSLATPIPVQGGDILGMYEDGWGDCAAVTAVPPGIQTPYDNVAAAPAAGSTLTPTSPHSLQMDIEISATLTPALPTAKDQCMNGGWKSFGVFKNQGDCVSYVATHGKNPPAGS